MKGSLQNCCCVVVKLGGSVITRGGGEFDADNTYTLAQEIAGYGQQILIVHGGGSITKSLVFEHNLESDFLTTEHHKFIKQFREAVQGLNENILKIFNDVGIKCASITSHTILASRDGVITKCDTTQVKKMLAAGITPILYGDVLMDEARGYYTCSSDQIVSFFAKVLTPKAVLFLTDVNGVYEDYPPESDQVKPLPIADSSLLHRISNNYEVGKSDMHSKFREAIACTPFTHFCCILNGRICGNLSKALEEHVCLGTKII